MALTPAASARAASSGALRERSSQPRRIFRVTGRATESTVAFTRVSAWSRSRIRAEPESTPVTSREGQPMLMSITWAPAASASLAPEAIQAASQPTSWTTMSGRPSPTAARRTTSGRPRASSVQATISVAT